MSVWSTNVVIFDKSDAVKCWISNENDNSSTRLLAGILTDVLNGDINLEFSIPLDSLEASLIEESDQVAVEIAPNKWQLFEIKEITKIKEENEVHYACRHAMLELADHVVLDKVFYNTTATGSIMDYLLIGTRWTKGIANPSFDKHDIAFSNMSVLDCFAHLISVFGMEISFDFTITGSKIITRTVNVQWSRGSNKGLRFEWKKNLIGIERTVNTDNLKTALIGIGANLSEGTIDSENSNLAPKNPKYTTITEIEWKTSANSNILHPKQGTFLDLIYMGVTTTSNTGKLYLDKVNKVQTASAKAIKSSITAENMAITTKPYPTPIEPSIQYIFSCSIKSNATITGSLGAWFYDSEGNFISSIASTTFSATTTFTRRSLTFTTPSNASYVSVGATIINATNKSQFWIDALMLDKGNVLNTWLSGGTYGGKTYAKAKGIPFVEDVAAKNTWGRLQGANRLNRVGLYVNNEQKDPNKLLEETLKALDNLKYPIASYQAKVVDLYKVLANSTYQAELGDRVTVIDDDLGLTLTPRIVEIKNNLLVPEDTEIIFETLQGTLASPKMASQQIIGPSALSIADQNQLIIDMNKNLGDVSNDVNEVIVEVEGKQDFIPAQTTAPSNPTVNMYWLDTSVVPNILKRWDGIAWIKASPTSASEIGGIDQSYVDAQLTLKENYITRSATAPSSPVLNQTWLDSSTNPPTWKTWNGTAWVKMTRSDLGEMTGAISPSQITTQTITTVGVDATAIKTGILDANRIGAESISTNKLTVVARNMVNNFSRTGNILNWTPVITPSSFTLGNTPGTLPPSNFRAGYQVGILTNANDLSVYSDWFEVDPNKTYKVQMSIYHNSTLGSVFFGIYASTDGINANQAVIPFNTTTRTFLAESSNPYFHSLTKVATVGASGNNQGWIDIEGYILGENVQSTEVPLNSSNTVATQFFKMKPNTKWIRLRFLNYHSSPNYGDGVTPTTAYYYNPSVTEIGTGALNAETIKAGVLSATNGVTTLSLNDGAFRMGGSQFFRIGSSDVAYKMKFEGGVLSLLDSSISSSAQYTDNEFFQGTSFTFTSAITIASGKVDIVDTASTYFARRRSVLGSNGITVLSNPTTTSPTMTSFDSRVDLNADGLFLRRNSLNSSYETALIFDTTNFADNGIDLICTNSNSHIGLIADNINTSGPIKVTITSGSPVFTGTVETGESQIELKQGTDKTLRLFTRTGTSDTTAMECGMYDVKRGLTFFRYNGGSTNKLEFENVTVFQNSGYFELGSFSGTYGSANKMQTWYNSNASVWNVGARKISDNTSVDCGIAMSGTMNVGGNLLCANAYTNTSASAANQFITSSGQMYRSTSSLKYKTQIEDLWSEHYMKVLDLRPIWYRSNSEIDRKDWSHIGLIAEEVDLIEPRLVQYKEGENGELECEHVQYERIGVMLIPIVKDLLNRVEELERRL